MRKVSLMLSALIMIFCFCGSVVQDPAAPEVSPFPAPTEEVHTVSPPPLAAAEPNVPEPETSPAPSPEVPKQSSIFDLIAVDAPRAEPVYHVDMAAYYMDYMTAAAAEGDVNAGRIAEENRNAAIDASREDTAKISFDDLYLLARLIYSEAGSDWLDEEFRLCVGEVALNRVASPEFPDTLYEVVYQKGQYTGVNTVRFANLKPGEDCVDVALKLLQGERRMVPAVVYQSDYLQGELFSMYSDRRLGNTYFCLSTNIDLYE